MVMTIEQIGYLIFDGIDDSIEGRLAV